MTRSLALLLACACLLAAPWARASWKNTTVPMPVERLLRNARAYIQEHPGEGRGYYVLGRLHSMVFAQAAETLALNPPRTEGASLPGFPPWDTVRQRPGKGWTSTPKAREHLLASIRNYRKACDLDAGAAIHHLGLAWMIEQALAVDADLSPLLPPLQPGAQAPPGVEALVKKLGHPSYEEREEAARALEARLAEALPALRAHRLSEDAEIRARVGRLLERWWEDRALDAYRDAYRLTAEKDARTPCRGPMRDDHISCEAGRALLRLLRSRAPTEERNKEILAVEEHVQTMERKPREVTPLLLPLDRPAPLRELLDPGRVVSFDLDGDGVPGRWPWIRPRAGLLVWDPRSTGRVRSGLSLFGSVTWWIAWPHAYAALALLDDDRNGWLEGPEIAGLALWQDRDADGVSDPGEVRPLARWGVTALAVRPAGTQDGVPCHPAGARMADGSTRPTYDWTPRRR